MHKRNLLIVAALLGLGAMAWWGMSLFGSGTPAPAGGPPAVNALRLTPQTVPLYKELPGRLTASKSGEIRPQVSGIITERLFEEGSTVEKGEQLYQIDPASYQAAYNSAAAELQKAQALVKSVQAKAGRYAELVKIDAISRQEYDDITAALAQARADVAVAEAALATAKVNLDYTKVYAPISGEIGKSNVTPGALVTANQTQPLAVVTQLDPIYVDLTLPSRELMNLRREVGPSATVPVTLLDEDGTPATSQAGTLQFSEVNVDQTTGSVLLRAIFPNPEGRLLPGMFARARIHLQPKQGLLVPQSATVRKPDGTLTIWVVNEDNTVQPQPIQTADAVSGSWLVTEGLAPGTVIVAEGFQKAQPGQPVQPTFPEQAPAAGPSTEGE